MPLVRDHVQISLRRPRQQPHFIRKGILVAIQILAFALLLALWLASSSWSSSDLAVGSLESVFFGSQQTPPTKASNFSISTGDYQHPNIAKHGCGITVVFMDPSIDAAALWALESVAHFLQPRDQVCIVLHTSACQDSSLESKSQRIHSQAMPYFTQLIDQGQVRISVLNHSLYGLASCSNFFSPSIAWQNYHYWSREFSPQDSDFVLVLQADAVLCRPLYFEKWQDAAWVGAPWPARRAKFGAKPWDHCDAMPRNWKQYHQHVAKENEVPPYPTPQQLCSEHEKAPQGNGGLSLRKRSWLLKAIEYCPTTASGLDEVSVQNAACFAQHTPAEDIYFVTILKGLNAPLPSALDAALLALESTPLEKILSQFNISEQVLKERMTARGASQTIGIHKPWNPAIYPYHLCQANATMECPYLFKIMEHSKYGQKAMALKGRPSCWK